MKIISIEKNNAGINYALKKDILIPCYVYKVPIEMKKDNELNFFEKTILDLKKIRPDLTVAELSHMLGFYNENNDKTEIVKLVVKKLENLKISQPTEDEKENTNVEIFSFYQEAYTNKLLPVITRNINEFYYVEKNKYVDDNIRKITFKKGEKDIVSYLPLVTLMKVKPKKEDILKTIFIHNKNYTNGSKYVQKINSKSFKIDVGEDAELIYLHVKLYIPKNNVQTFVVTDGLTNNFSFIFKDLLENQYSEFVTSIKKSLRTDIDAKNKEIEIPFESKINQFPEVKRNIEQLEKVFKSFDYSSSTLEKEKRSKENIVKSLYDLLEKSFESLMTKEKENKTLQYNPKLIYDLSNNFGFKSNNKLDIFKVTRRYNLQKYLAKALFYKKAELYEVAYQYTGILNEFDTLLMLRNKLKHSEENVKINIDLHASKSIIYKVVSLLLKVKQVDISKEVDEVNEDEDTYFNNAYIDLESDFSLDVLKQIPEYITDNLNQINFYLNELNFSKDQYNIVKNVINDLYSSFEYIMKNKLQMYKHISISKDDLLKSLEHLDLPNTLTTVNEKYIDSVQKAQGGTLGAYILLYLYHNQEQDNKNMITLISKIITIRGHGNPDINDVAQITKDDLVALKDDAFELIKKMIKE